jgi:hypothetical protein
MSADPPVPDALLLPTEQPEDRRGRFMLNGYGRRCYELGFAAAQAEGCNTKEAFVADPPVPQSLEEADIQLLAWAVTNCHMLARRALARSTSVFDREKWEHVLRICEKAGARSQGVLRAALPTEITDGADPPVPVALDALLRELIEQWRSSSAWMMGSTSPDEWQKGSSAHLRKCASQLEAALRAAGPQRTPDGE